MTFDERFVTICAQNGCCAPGDTFISFANVKGGMSFCYEHIFHAQLLYNRYKTREFIMNPIEMAVIPLEWTKNIDRAQIAKELEEINAIITEREKFQSLIKNKLRNPIIYEPWILHLRIIARNRKELLMCADTNTCIRKMRGLRFLREEILREAKECKQKKETMPTEFIDMNALVGCDMDFELRPCGLATINEIDENVAV